MISTLSEVYDYMVDYFATFAGILYDDVIFGLLMTFAGGIASKETAAQVSQGVSRNLFVIFSFYLKLPSSDCFQVGYKFGAPIRMSTGLSVESAKGTAL